MGTFNTAAMKRRTAALHAAAPRKSRRAPRPTLAGGEAARWTGNGEMGAHEVVADMNLSSSGGDFGFATEADERSDVR
jgi:hypothetical protein